MPRSSRRNPPSSGEQTTPTRNPAINPITAPIPSSMLQTPPHAPFLNTNSPGFPPIPQPQFQRASQETPFNQQQAAESTTSQVQRRLSSASSTTSRSISNNSLESPGERSQTPTSNPSFPALLPGLREISPLATWTLSSSKPGCSLAQLRHPSPSQFWQSDGPQPHTLTLHFFKLVAIVKMRIYLDFELDESYTPTKIRFAAGMSEGGLVEFGAWDAPAEEIGGMENVRGWIDVDLRGVGGRERRKGDETLGAWGITEYHTPEQQNMDVDDEEPGDVLKCMVVQVRICENHQNGKDTHVRGFQVFARDENAVIGGGRKPTGKKIRKKADVDGRDEHDEQGVEEEVVSIEEADWMGEPEIR